MIDAAAAPDFLGIGAQKAGTTWLFKRLCMHPGIYFPGGKEIHFWDRRDAQPDRPVERYTAIFSGRIATGLDHKCGEITPAYLLLSEARIREIAALAPQARLIAILRDPVQRALSAAAQHRAFRPEEARESDPLTWPRTLEPGFYAKHLTRWLRHFPREQLLILAHDDIAGDAVGVLKRTARHIGVDPGVYDLIHPDLLASRVFETTRRITPDETALARLRALYRPDVAALETMMGRRLGWLG